MSFSCIHTDDNGQPTTITHERAGYFDLGPMDLGENARRDMVLTLEDMGFEIEASHHEMAPAQHEIDFRYDEALTDGRQYHDIQAGSQDDRQTPWTACKLYAKAKDRHQWLRHAHQYVPVKGWKKYFCG